MRVGKEIGLVLVILLCLSFTAACSSIQIEVLGEEQEQEQLFAIFQNRTQILSVEFHREVLSIKVNNEIIRFSTRSLPYLCSDAKGQWLVNGNVAYDLILGNTNNSPLFPSLEISPDGFLIVNGKESQFKWSSKALERICNNRGRIWAIANNGTFLCFYRYDEESLFLPIVTTNDCVIPDYYFNLVVEKEYLAERIMEDCPTEDCLGYVFFTDAHWGRNQKHSPAIVKHIVDYMPIEYVIFGGDVNTNKTNTIQETLDIGMSFQNAFSFLGKDFYCVFGNHDDNATGQVDLKERHLTEAQVFSYLQSQMTTVTYGGYYSFYFDDSITKTRFLCLDTGRYFSGYNTERMVATARFTIDALTSVKEGWHIVAVSHIWSALQDFEQGNCIESPIIKPIIDILEDYNFRRNGKSHVSNQLIEYDFSNSGARVEYCIGGHSHVDNILYSEEGLPIITVTCDGQQEVAGGAPFQTGTINEQCVTIVVNDYNDRKVHMFRIGRGTDCVVEMWRKGQNLL